MSLPANPEKGLSTFRPVIFYTRLLKRYCTVSARRSKSSSSNVFTRDSSVKSCPQQEQRNPTERQVNRVISSPSGQVGQWTPVSCATGLRGTNCVWKVAISSLVSFSVPPADSHCRRHVLLQQHHSYTRSARIPSRKSIFLQKKRGIIRFSGCFQSKNLTLYSLYTILSIYHFPSKKTRSFSLFYRRRQKFKVKPLRGSVLNPTPNRQVRISNG